GRLYHDLFVGRLQRLRAVAILRDLKLSFQIASPAGSCRQVRLWTQSPRVRDWTMNVLAHEDFGGSALPQLGGSPDGGAVPPALQFLTDSTLIVEGGCPTLPPFALPGISPLKGQGYRIW